MRLKSVFIGQYKNLRNFQLDFDGTSFIDVFVGKNGSGKSNLFEALIEIFRHLVEFGRPENTMDFEYRLKYEIDDNDTSIEWTNGELKVNGRNRKTLGATPVPDNVLIYYSGHNATVSELVARYEASFRRRFGAQTWRTADVSSVSVQTTSRYFWRSCSHNLKITRHVLLSVRN